jgi:hypothetical protein
MAETGNQKPIVKIEESDPLIGAPMKVKHVLWVVAAVFLILLLIILLPIDDELDAEAAAWVEEANRIEDVEGNGYHYLMGFMSNPSHDPATAGRELIDAYRVAERKLLSGEIDEFAQEEYPAERALLMPEGDYYCGIDEPGCFTRLAANPDALQVELSEHFVLLLRYQTFIQFEHMEFLLEPTLYEGFPPYLYLLRGHRLNQFRIVLESHEGDPERAISMLYEDMAQLRRHLAGASALLDKMTLLSMLESDLDLLFNLAPAAAQTNLPALTPAERSLRSAIIREFGYLANFHRQMELNPDSMGDLDGYGWLIRATVKPNMTLNSLFPYYQDIAALAAVDAALFAQTVAAGEPKVNTEFKLRNIGGSVLNSISTPSLTRYIARLHDVDCKIALLNAALKLDPSEWDKILKREAGLQADNPYNPEEQPYVDNETQAVCFPGPLPDSRHRCIRRDRVEKAA